MELATVWLKLLACAALIGFAGPILTRYGDIIARLTGLSRSWVGLILLATATSLPELFTGMSAVTLAKAPDIAMGDALGSCVLNLAMLVILDAMSRDEPVYKSIDQGHALASGFSIILIGSVGALTLMGEAGVGQFFHIGLSTPLIIAIYFLAMRTAYVYDRRNRPLPPLTEQPEAVSLQTALIRYAAAATVVVAAGTWLPFVGQELADTLGWRDSFVGTLFIAAATSLPELVVTVSALRLGAADMAIASLLGSNLFDMLVLAIDDILFTGGPLFAAVARIHALTAFAAVIMTGIFIVAILYRPQSRLFGTVGWVSIALLCVYLLSAYAVFLQRA